MDRGGAIRFGELDKGLQSLNEKCSLLFRPVRAGRIDRSRRLLMPWAGPPERIRPITISAAMPAQDGHRSVI